MTGSEAQNGLTGENRGPMTDALMVTSSFLPGRGGIESYLAELCDELAPRLAVLAPRARDGMRLPGDLSYRTVAGPAGMLIPHPRVARGIVQTAREVATDRVLFGTPWPLLLLAPAVKRAGLRYSVIVHGAELLVPSVIPAVAGTMATALAAAEAIFPVSDYTGTKVKEFLERKRRRVPPVHTLRARVDVDRFRPDIDTGAARARYRLADDDHVVLTFGRLVRRKGVDHLIAALPAIRERVPRTVLLVAGTGPEESRLRKLASGHDGIVFTGRVPDELAPQVHALADVFVLGVRDRYQGLETEGLGIVLVEAAACGVPCVTGRSGGTPEAVVDGSTGFVIDATDQAALVDRVAGLLENPHLSKQMGAAGRKHVIANFSGSTRLQPLLDWLG